MINTCGKCGLSHSKLGVRIQDGTLYRSNADKTRHLLRAGGGAWAFETPLIQQHPEVDYLFVSTIDGETYHVSRRTFEAHAFKWTAAGRDQRALSLKHWQRDGHSDPQPEPDSGAVQELLIPSTAVERSRFEPAKEKRPRITQTRRRWFGA